MSNEQIPLTVARHQFGSIINDVRDGAHVELAHHGHVIAVIIPITDYRRMTLEADPAYNGSE